MRLIALLLCITSAASAQRSDVWSDPSPGVRYLHRTIDTPATSIYALIIDLSHEGVSIEATPQDERWQTVSEIASDRGAVGAINGGFWGLWQRPTGVTAGGGELWNNSEPDPDFGHFAILGNGRAVVMGAGEGEDEASLRRVRESVSGRPIIVRDGAPAEDDLAAFATSNQRQPRTAVGVSRDGRTVYFVVVDGRQSHSHGATLYTLANLLVELGASRAINLDGGGSSAMFVASAGGVVNRPSQTRWQAALGMTNEETRPTRTAHGQDQVQVRVERQVMNHLMVFAPQAAPVIDAPQMITDQRPAAPVVPARRVHHSQPSLRVGLILREAVPPVVTFVVPIAFFAALTYAFIRARRRRATLRVV